MQEIRTNEGLFVNTEVTKAVAHILGRGKANPRGFTEGLQLPATEVILQGQPIVTTNNNLLKEFPNKRIKPVDGMAVTADVWEEEHRYHRQLLRYHNLYNHGSGIVTGLQVIASDPADTSVYILPGVAVDSVGNTIVISEPTEQKEAIMYVWETGS